MARRCWRRAQETLKRDPRSGHLFVPRGRRGGLITVLWHNGQGTCLFAKGRERGRFIWPSPADGVVTISSANSATPRRQWSSTGRVRNYEKGYGDAFLEG